MSSLSVQKARLSDHEALYKRSINSPEEFWGTMARTMLTWDTFFHRACSGTLEAGNAHWFDGGRLNASFNCVDRHALNTPHAPAIIFASDDGSADKTLSYEELLAEVCSLAHVLKDLSVRRGDTVSIYLPMIAEAVVAVLACTRIGAIHSVIFAGFSAEAARDRFSDAQSSVIITSDESKRGGRTIGLKKIVDQALDHEACSHVSSVLVLRNTGGDVNWSANRDRWWHEEVAKWPKYIAPESMASEDPLFLLYTSGSTGKPKGVLHTTAGYLLGAALTGKHIFDIRQGDRFFCTGDVGWITGHTYAIYSPLLLGVPTVIFEGTPTYPDASRLWNIIDRYDITHLYAAPTALRVLKRLGDEHVKIRSQALRVLGSVGEPISPDLWEWYNTVVGKGRCSVVDTYWQTETGSHAIAPLAGVVPTKPGAATLPFFGFEPVLLDAVTGSPLHGNNVEGVLAFKHPWPSMARTIWKDHKRYMETYLQVYKGHYFTGDSAYRDHDGYYWIRGRVDDVINVSGHRLSTSEVESALVEHKTVTEAAVVGVSDEITGQAILAFVSTKQADDAQALRQALVKHVRSRIGPFASPKRIVLVDDLPKTRSGKVMRRVLRKIASGEADQLGDTSTLADPSVVQQILQATSLQA